MPEGTGSAPAAPAAPTQTNGAGGQQTPAGGAPPPKADATPTPSWKPPPLKVYGAERNVDPDLYHQYAQKGAAFAHQSEEMQRRQAELDARDKSLAERIKKDPWAFIREHNPDFDPRKAAAQYVVDSAREEELTPEQKEAREAKAKLAEYEAKAKEGEQKAHAEKVKQVKELRTRELGQQWVAELTKAGVPEGPGAWLYVAKMADYQAHADALMAEGKLDREPDAALMAKMAMEEVQTSTRGTVGKLRGPDLLHAMGDDWVNAVVEAKFSALNGAKQAAGAGGQQPLPPQNRGPGVREPVNGQFVSRERQEFLTRLGITDQK